MSETIKGILATLYVVFLFWLAWNHGLGWVALLIITDFIMWPIGVKLGIYHPKRMHRPHNYL